MEVYVDRLKNQRKRVEISSIFWYNSLIRSNGSTPKKYKNKTMNDQVLISKIAESITSAKSSISASEKWLEKLAKNMGVESTNITISTREVESSKFDGDRKVIEGTFDGQNMLSTDGKVYPVPANYASKSKLVEGDQLKLTISENGAFIFKQIELIPRELKIGNLVMDGSQYQVLVDTHTYNVLYASVTFFRAHPGDQVTVIVPSDKESKWAAVENIIPSHQAEEVVI